MKIIKTCFSQQIFNSSYSSSRPLSPNPAPNSFSTSTANNSSITFPCGVCQKSVNDNHHAVLCDICDKWIHIKCNYLNNNDYKKLKNRNETFYCINCTKDISPFSNMNSNEFFTSVVKGVLNTENKNVDFTPSVYQHNLFNQLNTFMDANRSIDEADEGEDFISHSINCKYYGINEFTREKFCSSRSFSILHYNIHSIELHIEEFRVNLQMLEFDFDIICISESKIVDGIDPKCDISIPNYQTPISTPTEGTKGGVLIYVKSGIDFKPRNDLKICKSKELESAFIEVINKNESNDVIGVIYRHPCMNENDFIDNYLTEQQNRTSYHFQHTDT